MTSFLITYGIAEIDEKVNTFMLVIRFGINVIDGEGKQAAVAVTSQLSL